MMGMTDEEIAEFQPDYIVLDEFHRCGAEMWGQGVQKLLSTYAATSVLGLSATAIRCLDNQRDMADELLDGNVASEITLGEAIVRGILAAPKYVLSVFSYQKDLERYKARVRRAKSKVVRDEAERYLDALRRALEKADGLDVIFDKHMTERTGKYIVFCANKEHMGTMMDKVPDGSAALIRLHTSIPYTPTIPPPVSPLRTSRQMRIPIGTPGMPKQRHITTFTIRCHIILHHSLIRTKKSFTNGRDSSVAKEKLES